jgi:hypothetical protein
VKFWEMPEEEQARNQSTLGLIYGALGQLRMVQRSEHYREAAIIVYQVIALLAEEEARALEG